MPDIITDAEKELEDFVGPKPPGYHKAVESFGKMVKDYYKKRDKDDEPDKGEPGRGR